MLKILTNSKNIIIPIFIMHKSLSQSESHAPVRLIGSQLISIYSTRKANSPTP